MSATVETQLIDGKATAARVRECLTREVAEEGLTPCLATVLVGDDPASAVYVRMKTKAAAKIGIEVTDRKLPADVGQDELAAVIRELNADDAVDGILLQLPLPGDLDEESLLAEIDPMKDVDGFHPVNLGRLVRGLPAHRACTPAGCMQLIEETGVEIRGKEAVVVGRSNIVGKPMALLLLQANATVTVCHSRTADLEAHVRRAEILVASVGRPHHIPGEWIQPGAVVIDVGINRLDDGSLTGDVETAGARGRAAHITPVPGGVGPMTIAHLMQNTVNSHRMRREGRTWA